MKERPIIFSGPMVQELLAGTKTQTRRAVKITHRTPGLAAYLQLAGGPAWARPTKVAHELCPYGAPGDHLWVRETYAAFCPVDNRRYYRTGVIRQEPISEHNTAAREVVYRADGQDVTKPHPRNAVARWRSPIHMQRWASRVDLELTGVRIERLQDISAADARAEGCKGAVIAIDTQGYSVGQVAGGGAISPREEYRGLWDCINGAGSWDADPWVWVLTFKRAAP